MQNVCTKGKANFSIIGRVYTCPKSALCAEQHSFLCQEPEANGYQVLLGTGYYAFHQNSVECTQDDFINKEVAQEKVVDNDKSDINTSYLTSLPQIIVGRIAIKSRKMTSQS